MGRAVAIGRLDLTAEGLRSAASVEKDGAAARRILALALILEGADRASAARICGMDRQTLRDWVHRYNDEGLAGLRDRAGGGRSPKLSKDQRAEFAALVAAGPDPALHKVVRWRRLIGARRSSGALASKCTNGPNAGGRPRAPRDQRYEWAYIFGAVCPERSATAALVLPCANAEAMNLHLVEISKQVAAGAHAVLLLDGAGYIKKRPSNSRPT